MKRLRLVGSLGMAGLLALMSNQPGVSVAQTSSESYAQAPALHPFSTRELSAFERVVAEHPEVRALFQGQVAPRVIIGQPQFDKAEAQAFLSGQSAKPPKLRAEAFVVDSEGNVVQKAILDPTENRVLSVERVEKASAPFVMDDVHAAWALAQRDPKTREELGPLVEKFKVGSADGSPGQTFVVEALPLRSADPKDPCSRDRCMDLIFRGEHGYLPLRVEVDLTAQTVVVQGRQ